MGIISEVAQRDIDAAELKQRRAVDAEQEKADIFSQGHDSGVSRTIDGLAALQAQDRAIQSMGTVAQDRDYRGVGGLAGVQYSPQQIAEFEAMDRAQQSMGNVAQQTW